MKEQKNEYGINFILQAILNLWYYFQVLLWACLFLSLLFINMVLSTFFVIYLKRKFSPIGWD